MKKVKIAKNLKQLNFSALPDWIRLMLGAPLFKALDQLRFWETQEKIMNTKGSMPLYVLN